MADSKKIDVEFSIDNNYIQHFCVAVTSLLENNFNHICRIFLITDFVESEALVKTISFIYSRFKIKICCTKIEESVLRKFKVDSHVSQATYYRLFLTELLPNDIDKVLYLDSDVVVNGSLASLFNLKFQSELQVSTSSKHINNILLASKDLYLYAVSEVNWQDPDRLRSIGLMGYRYFNAGVLLINLKRWREDKVLKKLITIALDKSINLKFHDQDVLNIAFENNWGELHYKYNTVNLDFLKHKVYESDYHIIHYTSGSKPWHFINRHPLKHIYWNYLRKTPYKYYIPHDLTLRNIIKKYIFSYF